jgi:hypothetical protein
MSDIPRVCATCKHFVFHESEPDYSELTPGADCSFSCSKGYWHANGGSCTEAEFRSSMLAATHCLDYEAVEVAPRAFHPTFPLDVGGSTEEIPDRLRQLATGQDELFDVLGLVKIGKTFAGSPETIYKALVESLAARYPGFLIGITNYPHRAFYDNGDGVTTSGSFVAPGQAYVWLEERLRQMTAVEVPSAVEAR